MKGIIEEYSDVVISVIGVASVIYILADIIMKYKDIIWSFMNEIMFR